MAKAKLIQLPGASPVNEGEKLVVNCLREQLPGTYTLIPNVEIIQWGQPPFEYDIIVIAPHAVYVVEIKQWRGGICGDDHTWIVNGKYRRPSPWRTINNKARVAKSEILRRQPNCGPLWVEAVIAIADKQGELDLQGNLSKRVFRYTDLPAFLSNASALGRKAKKLHSKRAYIEKAIEEAARGRSVAPLCFGDYEVQETLSRQGGVADYLAHNILLEREEPVRLRVFSYDPYLEEDALLHRREIIRREAKSLQEIGAHPNLITLQGFFTAPNDPNLFVEVTEWSEEGTLRELMRANEQISLEQALEQALELVQEMAAGIKVVHDAGVIHRDIRPENVLIGRDGRPRLMNFDHARLPLPGVRTVSPIQHDPDVSRAYLAPELLANSPCPATDIYGLGMIWFEMLVGDTPYDSPEQALQAGTISAGPKGYIDEDIPARLNDLVRRMISLDPARRPQKVDEVLTELNAIINEINLPTEPEPPRGEDEPPVPQPGDVIDEKYEVKEVLEAGASGRVYKVYESVFDQVYALKIFENTSLSLDFLKQEAKALRAVSHPNIVHVHNWGKLPSGRLYLVIDFVEGEDLTRYTNPEHRLPLRMAVKAILELLSALQALHPDVDRIEALRIKMEQGEITQEEYEMFGRLQSEGWLHRDIKPANLMLTPSGHLKLVDFNIAAHISKVGHTYTGTPSYMLPDIGIMPWSTDSDLFATGIVLYELITGHHPYPNNRPNAQDTPTDPRQYVPNLRPELAKLLRRAVSCDPARRYHSAQRFQRNLESAMIEPGTNYPHAPSGCTPGEREVFNALRWNLTHGYSIWFEPTLFGQKRKPRPDFTVWGPDIGIVVVEVEEASITGAYSPDQFMEQIHLTQQAESYAHTLKEAIEQCRETAPSKYQSLLEKSEDHKGKLAMPISAAVAFPSISHAAWQSAELRLYDTSDEKAILLKDDLGSDLLKRLRDIPPFRSDLSQVQLETLRQILFPEIRVPSSRGSEVTLDEDQIGPVLIDITLPPQAEEIAQEPQVRLVRGVVGSGKTLILLLRAKFISEQNPDWRILMLTYNKTLMNYLREGFERIGGDPERVEIVNFHKWCSDLLPPDTPFTNPQTQMSLKGLIVSILKESNVTTFDPQFLLDEFQWIKEQVRYENWENYLDPKKVKRVGRGRGLGRYEAQKRQEIYDLFLRYNERLLQNKMGDWADLPILALEAMEKGFIEEKKKYHAVLIDEAQDFAPSWFRVAFGMVKPETNMIFITGDGAQRIYRRDFTWKELGLVITAQNSYILKRSYRSTREIIDVALDVIQNSPALMTELEDAGDAFVDTEEGYVEYRHGPLPVLRAFESSAEEYDWIADEIFSLSKQDYSLEDIAILHRRREGVRKIIQTLHRHEITCDSVTATDATDPAVTISTFHSAKGLEFEIVFVCGLEELKVDEEVDIQSDEYQQLLDQERKLLYVAMTRARQILNITYSGAGPAWIVEQLQHKLKEMQSED